MTFIYFLDCFPDKFQIIFFFFDAWPQIQLGQVRNEVYNLNLEFLLIQWQSEKSVASGVRKWYLSAPEITTSWNVTWKLWTHTCSTVFSRKRI